MKIGTYGASSIYRTGEPIADGGDGVKWRCTCPRGEPGTEGYPCRHLRGLFSAARDGQVSRHVHLTPEGEAAAAACGCIAEARQNGRDKPAKPRAPEEPAREGPARTRPCPCGSGKKYKKCHGLPGAPPLPVEPAEVEPAEVEPAEDEAEKKRRERAEKRAEKGERLESERKRIDAILDRIHAEEVERAERQSAARLERVRARELSDAETRATRAEPSPAELEERIRARAERTAARAEKTAADSRRIDAILDRIHAREDARTARRLARKGAKS